MSIRGISQFMVDHSLDRERSRRADDAPPSLAQDRRLMNRRSRRRGIGRFNGGMVALVLMMATAGVERSASSAQPVTPRAPQAAPANNAVDTSDRPTSRADLAAALIRFEQALALAAALLPHGGEAHESLMRDMNERFDRLTLGFFAGRMDQARSQLEDLTKSLLERLGIAPDTAALIARGDGTCAPGLINAQKGATVEVSLGRLAPGASLAESARSGVLAGSCAVGVAVDFGADGRATVMITPLSSPCRLEVRLTGVPLAVAHLDAIDGEAEALLARLDSKLAEIRARAEASRASADNPPFAIDPHSLIAVESRVELLRGMIDARTAEAPARRSRLAMQVVDMAAHATAVTRELEALLEGRDPYRTATFDGWREFDSSGVRIPMRVFAPSPDGAVCGQARPEGPIAPRPLVIALHGAGGDENMFMEAYGAGLLRNLAEEHGFVAVSPLTTVFATSPLHFDALVREMERCHGIDPARVMILGHSMGAGATASIVSQRAESIAAAAMMAGGASISARGGGVPPIRIDAGALDPLIPASRLARAAEEMRRAGLDVVFTAHEGRGHTLIVGEVLPEVVAWLLNERASDQSR
ncbi:MAG: dienelactone hydrolase family protein [Phycisphaeraceae bacterium]|nr:dienelactone hydrolase family protein [Phycisphaeraceae bacterium]